tara:strand:- start:1840 stop:2385 length:546 start_codon:yes stop_codon:yes gene_type:complete
MARGLSNSLKTELANQNIKPILLVEILFPIPQRITNHYKDITHNSNTYSASGHLLSITNKAENAEINVSNFTINLSAVDSAFTSIILNNNVANDIVTIDIGLLNSTDALIDTYNYDKGYIESFRIDTKQATISLICTSHFSDFSRIAGRKTNEGSQQRLFPTDRGFEFAGQTVQDIKWGRA